MRAEAQAHIDQINAATALLRRFLDWDRARGGWTSSTPRSRTRRCGTILRRPRRSCASGGGSKRRLARRRRIERELTDTVELIEMAEAEGDDALVDDGVRSLGELAERAERDKVAALLAGEADANNAYVEINAGAGGTESQDWAEMLQRMYTPLGRAPRDEGRAGRSSLGRAGRASSRRPC